MDTRECEFIEVGQSELLGKVQLLKEGERVKNSNAYDSEKYT